MKVLLIKDVKGLGKAGDVKDVKDGYANNFLIAKGFAQIATNAVLKQFEANKVKMAELQAYELSQTQKFASDLEKIQINLIVKIGANGALFGSITKDEISNALKTQKGLELDKKCLEFEHIKTPGIYEITAKLKHGINAKFKLEIKGE